ncbi:MAG: tetratricopeptide repeat protein, partial [Candidatus Schmidhempelia sp.]|nr:tetratricopeptide repeat protein [Candidatus Schmidhempelia sp.]
MKLYQQFLAIVISASMLAACSSSHIDYNSVPEADLFIKSQTALDNGSLKSATTLLEAMDKSYPFGPYSQQIQLNLIYTYYKTSDFAVAI